MTSDWGAAFSTDLAVKNTGPTINGWKLKFTFPGNQQLTESWESTYSQTGPDVTLTNAPWNGTLPTGGTIHIGFQASYSGTNAPPVSFAVNNVPC